MGDFIDLQGNVALVTGGAQGIGRSIVGLLADCGASVVVSDINRETAEKTVAELTAQGKKAMAVQANVARGEEVKAMVDSVVSQWGKIDILVNNAGITRDTLLLRMKDEDWDAVLSVNLKGTYHCMKAVLSSMSKQRRGRIINISSIVGVIGNAGQANYAASKAAVIGLSKTVAREYASRGITVNAVAPGFIDTAMTAVLSAEVKENLMKQIPLARLGSPSDIANAVVFLASDRAGYMTGQVLHVNGGMYMGG
ncbi:MAG: 3-oxoacyl-[acyl-carrier-protein] reductase [Candidatus Manganitrophus sp.]|nr:MAG: 3-oxoacyl-[acyl-carrier-protein] reductase [Candidatus Manganitrophus sp.]